MGKILMTPGPTNIPDEIFKAMSVNMHHRTEEFDEIFVRVNEKLKKLFYTHNDLIMLLSSGTGGLEASVVNLFSPGDKLLLVNCGVFGKRYGDIARLYGVDVREVIIDWGYGITEERLEEELKKEKYHGVYITYNETSTGVKNDIKLLGNIVKKFDCLFIVDIVSALGSLEFNAEEYGVDVAIAGSQKGLMCPPGLAIISMSDKAWDAVEKSRMPKFYFDFKKYKNLGMPYTPGVSLILGLDKSLDIIEQEGIDNVLSRHKKHSKVVKHCCGLMGLNEFPHDDFNSEALTAVYIPEGITAKPIIKSMYEYGIVIAGGQGNLKGKIIRIGHMGYVTDEHIIHTIESLGKTLNSLGYRNDTDVIVDEAKKIMGVVL